MKKIIGYAMLASPFVAIFILFGIKYGFGFVSLYFLGIIALGAFGWFAFRLIESNRN